MRIYRQGRISLVNSSVNVIATGTRFKNYVTAGDTLNAPDGNDYIIDSVQSHGVLVLTDAYLGDSIDNARYSIQRNPRVPTLDELKAAAHIRIDRLAGKVRLNYITDVPGQQATYLSKLEDALAYVAAGYPEDATPYIWMQAESAATGATPAQVADLAIATGEAWRSVGAAIEGARQGAKLAVNNANDAETITAAEATFKAAMGSLP